MELPVFKVDAFTNKPFSGNPAAVVIIDKWLPDEIMQQIAQENNLSETAFVCLEQEGFRIRWFTPKSEVNLCGHATLASGFVIFKYLYPNTNKITFFTQKAGNLFITRNGDWIEMDFPAYETIKINPPPGLIEALGTSPKEVLQAKEDILSIYESEKEIKNLKPKLQDLMKINTRGFIVSAKADSNSNGIDFVSRFFAPHHGIPEDPVTGSAHCTLTPYWGKLFGKKHMLAHQVSKRGGILKCELKKDRVVISGQAVCVLEGNLII